MRDLGDGGVGEAVGVSISLVEVHRHVVGGRGVWFGHTAFEVPTGFPSSDALSRGLYSWGLVRGGLE